MAVRPPIDATGIWTLKAPFDTLLATGVSYRSIGIRKIADLVAKGEGDPWESYYKPYDIDQATYQTDVAQDVCIVTLQAENGVSFYVPTSYIVSFPDSSGMTYITTILGVDLGAIPVKMSLNNIKLMIQDLIRDTIGVDTTVEEQTVGEKTQVDAASYASYEANRSMKIRNSTTFRARAIKAENDLAAANAEIAKLKEYIRNHP